MKRSASEVRKIRDSRLYRDGTRFQQLRDFPYCQLCDIEGKLIEAVQVDHKVPLEEGGEPHDPDNLQSLCKRCHTIKTAEENRQRNKANAIVSIKEKTYKRW